MNASPHSCVTLCDPRCLRCLVGDEAKIHEINVSRVIATYPDGVELELRYDRDRGWRFPGQDWGSSPEQRSSPGFDHAAGYPE